MLKQLDKWLILQFLPPVVLTFFIAMFVFIMQFFWKYIDEIAGKGLEWYYLLELIFWLSISLVPMALPVAILISSVMVLGSLGEHYEMASIKSAGVSLWRTMLPLVFISGIFFTISFVIANNIVPYSNLKFRVLLRDIRQQKTSFFLDEGIFNYDFENLVLRVGEKAEESGEIRDVLIYDHSDRKGNNSQIIAKSGEIYSSKDKRYMVMKLYEGHQYQDQKPASRKEKKKYPFVRTNFKSLEKIFDLSEFDLKETDENIYKGHEAMLTIRQSKAKIDSLRLKMFLKNNLLVYSRTYFNYRKRPKDSTMIYDPIPPDMKLEKNYNNIVDLIPEKKQAKALDRALTFARSVNSHSVSAQKSVERIEQMIVKHQLQIYQKINFALSCILFLFIGAPMGAIVRKGGFGWPMLISIIFFVVFIMLEITGRKLAEEMAIHSFVGGFLPCMVIFPFGIWLTYKAMQDANASSLNAFFTKVVSFFKREKPEEAIESNNSNSPDDPA